MCTSAKAPHSDWLNGYTGVFGGETLLPKAKCGSTSVLVDENGAVTDNKQVACRICDCSLADTRPGNPTNLFYCLQANHPEEHSEAAPRKAFEKSTKQATISGCFSAQQAYPRWPLWTNWYFVIIVIIIIVS